MAIYSPRFPRCLWDGCSEGLCRAVYGILWEPCLLTSLPFLALQNHPVRPLNGCCICGPDGARIHLKLAQNVVCHPYDTGFVDKQNASVSGSQGLVPRCLEPLKPGSTCVARQHMCSVRFSAWSSYWEVCETVKLQCTPKMLDIPQILVENPRH